MLTYCTTEGWQEKFYQVAQSPRREKAKWRGVGGGDYPKISKCKFTLYVNIVGGVRLSAHRAKQQTKWKQTKNGWSEQDASQ